jgi:hypothetical protein
LSFELKADVFISLTQNSKLIIHNLFPSFEPGAYFETRQEKATP